MSNENDNKPEEAAAAQAAAADAANGEQGKDEAKAEDKKSPEDIKAEAEAIEAENRQLREDAKAKDQEGRLEKAKRENAELKGEGNDAQPETKAEFEFDARGLIALDKAGIEEGSEEAKTVQKYIESGLVNNVAEALDNTGCKAELEVIKTGKTAATTIDENDTDEAIAQSKQEIIDQYESTGQIPLINGEPDPKATKVIAEHNRAKAKPGYKKS